MKTFEVVCLHQHSALSSIAWMGMKSCSKFLRILVNAGYFTDRNWISKTVDSPKSGHLHNSSIRCCDVPVTLFIPALATRSLHLTHTISTVYIQQNIFHFSVNIFYFSGSIFLFLGKYLSFSGTCFYLLRISFCFSENSINFSYCSWFL